MTADDRQEHRIGATYGHPAHVLVNATGPAAFAAFAERILAKYLPVPLVRRTPSLVLLRGRRRPDTEWDTSELGKVAPAASAATNAPTQAAVPLATAVDRPSMRPSPARLAAWLPNLSPPKPAFSRALQVQRRPLPVAPASRSPENRVLPPSISSAHGAPTRKPDTAWSRTLAPRLSIAASAGMTPYANSRPGADLRRQLSVPDNLPLVSRKALTRLSIGPPGHEPGESAPSVARAPTPKAGAEGKNREPGWGASARRKVAPASNAATDEPTQAAVPLATRVDRPSMRPAPAHLAATMVNLSPPKPVLALGLPVQRKPLRIAPASHAPTAMSAVAPCASDLALTVPQTPATALAMLGVHRGKTAADPVTPLAHGSWIGKPSSPGRSTVTQTDPAARRASTPHSLVGANAAGITPCTTSRPDTDLRRQLSGPDNHPLASRKPLTRPGIFAAELESGEIAPAVARVPAPRAAVDANRGTRPYAGPRAGWGRFQRLSMPGGHLLVQRKPLLRRAAYSALGASAITATPTGNSTRHARSALPLTTFAEGRDFLPEGRTTHQQWQPDRAPITYGQDLDRPLAAGLEQGHDSDGSLRAPHLTHLLDSPPAAAARPAARARSTATELTLRTASAEASPLPTLVAATLGAAAPPPTAAAPQALSASHGANLSSMSIQSLADRVFGILERRLVIERERRGIRS